MADREKAAGATNVAPATLSADRTISANGAEPRAFRQEEK